MDRMEVLQQGSKEDTYKLQETIGREDHMKMFSDSIHVYKEEFRSL
jgi:hypothetical protein